VFFEIRFVIAKVAGECGGGADVVCGFVGVEIRALSVVEITEARAGEVELRLEGETLPSGAGVGPSRGETSLLPFEKNALRFLRVEAEDDSDRGETAGAGVEEERKSRNPLPIFPLPLLLLSLVAFAAESASFSP